MPANRIGDPTDQTGFCFVAAKRKNPSTFIERLLSDLVAGAGSNLYLLPEQVKMVAGTGSHHNLLFETAA